MFDLITGKATHLPRHQGLPILVSTAAQVVVAGIVIAVPLMLVTDTLPEVPTMMAFVAAPPPPPPPPPPPAPAPAKRPVTPQPTPAPTPNQFVAPIEAPPSIEPERFVGEDEEGVPGGVEGGIPGGVVGGVVGGLPEPVPPPPPPPVPRGPVRIGGQIQTPALLRRVEPHYPALLVDSRIQGVVILEAVINEEGAVSDVKVLRSVHKLLDREAIQAVKQWRYSPLTLNGIRVPFVLTVTLSFTIEEPKE